MSMMATVKTQIKDLDVLAEVVGSQGMALVRTSQGTTIRTMGGTYVAEAKASSGGTYSLTFDTDAYDSPVIRDGKRFVDLYGKDAGKLLQLYGEAVVRKQAQRMGGAMVGRQVRSDGSVVLTFTTR